jgi:starch synthase
MRILHVASEVAPLAQSGGLADVVAALPAAEATRPDVEVGVIVPMYRGVAERAAAAGMTFADGDAFDLVVGWHRFACVLRIARVGRVQYGLLDCPALYDRAGTLYGPGGAGEFIDNHVRFAALGKAALEHGARLFGGPIDVLHAHDWQGAPAAIYARDLLARPCLVVTIHNLAYRGIFPKHVMDELGLPWSRFTLHDLEFYDQVSLLKGGLAAADVVTTVSPSYAEEILTPAFGEALDGFLRHDVARVVGIVNGIDTEAWDPAADDAIAASYSRDDLTGKAVCRDELVRELGLSVDPEHVLIGVIARMTGQKGVDLVADLVPELEQLGARMIVLGSGERDLEARFRWLADAFEAQLAVRIGFDVALARRIYAGCDAFVMPSRFEPCGLGQLYAMRYGTIPVVHAVGGLRDTVIDPGNEALALGNGTGVSFAPATAGALRIALSRAIRLVRDSRAVVALRRAAMDRDSSWDASARRYLEVCRAYSQARQGLEALP